MMEFTSEGRTCIPVGLAKTYAKWFELLNKVSLKKKDLAGFRQLQTWFKIILVR